VAPAAVILTSSLSPAPTAPLVPLLLQACLFVEFKVHVSNTALVVLSVTSTTAVSLPAKVALLAAYRFETVAPFAGMASESSLLAE
jgi:S-formylglutathione hydrolase FrmB